MLLKNNIMPRGVHTWARDLFFLINYACKWGTVESVQERQWRLKGYSSWFVAAAHHEVSFQWLTDLFSFGFADIRYCDCLGGKSVWKITLLMSTREFQKCTHKEERACQACSSISIRIVRTPRGTHAMGSLARHCHVLFNNAWNSKY